MALSKIPLDECEFIESVTKDFDCPICFQIMKGPFLTACCGNHFCEACIQTIKDKGDRRCPICNQKPFTGIIDKKFQRQINELNVYCLHRRRGCRWQGELGSLAGHLNMDKTDGQCKYVLLSCSLSCGSRLFRYELNKHVSKECQLRSATCKFCEYSSTYIDVTTKHQPVCPNCPVVCPNSCTRKKLKRSTLNEHLLTCPDEVIQCSFSEMGCKESLKRQCLQEHIEDNVMQHQLLMCNSFKQMRRDNAQLKKENEALRNAQSRTDHLVNGHALMVEEDMNACWRDLLQSLSVIPSSASDPISPVIIKWPDYCEVKQKAIVKAGDQLFYYSRPFYTHSGGYRLQLMVHPYGLSSGYGTHMSLYCCLMKGESDDSLRWPFKGYIMVTLLNQLEDSQHCSKKIRLTFDSANQKPVSLRNLSLGYCEFFSFSEIENSTTPNRRYLMNNTLFFNIRAHLL